MASSDIEEIKGFIKILNIGEVLPDDNGQAVIERIGNTRDRSALPTLRKALNACIEYNRWADTLPKDKPGLWIYKALSSKMESRLRLAIEKCTPDGEPLTYEKKWWQFWK